MIIAELDQELRIVRQIDHATQAGEMAEEWGNIQFPSIENSRSANIAVAQHDIGWVEPDGGELLYNPATRRPMNFTEVNLKDHVTFYKKGFERVMAQDPHAGLLVGMHWIGLYTSRFGYDQSFTYKTSEDLLGFMDDTITEQEKSWVDIKRRLWSGQQPLSQFEDVLWRQYEYLQFMDRLSLFLWTQDLSKPRSAVLGPLRVNGDSMTFNVRNEGSNRVIVAPFPFKASFTTKAVVRKIPARTYDSQRDVSGTLDRASEETVFVEIAAE